MFSDNVPLYLLTYLALSFFLCAFLILVLSHFARSRGFLLDDPTERKRHIGAIPLVGGLAMFLTLTFYAIASGSISVLGAIYLASLWLMLVGLADDLFELSSGFRLLAQIAAALLIVYYGDAQIYFVGNLFSDTEIRLERASLAFTVICVLGVINAFNMIDGIDGLSSGIAMLTTLSLMVVSISSVGVEVSLLMVTLLGSLLAFFLFNTGYFGLNRKVFMGDAGSTLLGFLLAWLFIVLSQNGAKPLSPVAAGWMFGLPLLDSVSVMVKRIVHGHSPFQADRNHLHHRLLDVGVSPRSTLVILVSIHSLMLCVGIALNGVDAAEPYLFWVFVMLVILRFYMIERGLQRIARKLTLN